METVHLGEIIKRVVKARRLTDKEVAKGVALTRQTVQQTYSEADMHTSKIRKFSEYLDHDFFAYLSPNKKYDFSKDEITQGEDVKIPYGIPKEEAEEVSLTFKVPRGMHQQILNMIINQPV